MHVTFLTRGRALKFGAKFLDRVHHARAFGVCQAICMRWAAQPGHELSISAQARTREPDRDQLIFH